jgi:hypothetical protein
MATLSVTIKEEVNLNGATRGSTIVNNITQVDKVYHQLIGVGTTEAVLFSTAATEAGATIPSANVKYLRITNINSTDVACDLRIADADQEYFVRLNQNESYILGNSLIDANATVGNNVTMSNLTSIKGKTASSSALLEVFIAA